MRADIAERWVAELRSGKYEQGQHRLRTVHGEYCCLGVLCEMAVADGVIPAPSPMYDTTFSTTVYDYDAKSGTGGATGYIPISVMEWAGMNSINGQFVAKVTDQTPATLASLNDRGATFEEIASKIEEMKEIL